MSSVQQLLDAATPLPWSTGFWSGQCHIPHNGKPWDQTLHGQGPERCVYDAEWVSTDDFHRIASVSKPDGDVTGNYEYESGGIINEADSKLIIYAVNHLPDYEAAVDALGSIWRTVEGLPDVQADPHGVQAALSYISEQAREALHRLRGDS